MKQFLRIFSYLGGIDETDEERRQKQLLAAYKNVFDSDDGKRILDDLANQFCFLAPTYDPDPTVMAMNEGSRNVMLYILGMIRDEYRNPIKEVIDGRS